MEGNVKKALKVFFLILFFEVLKMRMNSEF